MAIAPFKFGPSGTSSSILGNVKQLYQFWWTSNSFIQYWETSNSFIPVWVICKYFIWLCTQLETFGQIPTASNIFGN